eukprot:1109522-Pyramimonas_sp.AAC.1
MVKAKGAFRQEMPQPVVLLRRFLDLLLADDALPDMTHCARCGLVAAAGGAAAPGGAAGAASSSSAAPAAPPPPAVARRCAVCHMSWHKATLAIKYPRRRRDGEEEEEEE